MSKDSTFNVEAADRNGRVWVKQSFWMPKAWLDTPVTIARDRGRWLAMDCPYLAGENYSAQGDTIQEAVTNLDQLMEQADGSHR